MFQIQPEENRTVDSVLVTNEELHRNSFFVAVSKLKSLCVAQL